MSETCDFCKRTGLKDPNSCDEDYDPDAENPNRYETLDFKDTGLRHYGDMAVICQSCLKDLKKVLDKFWEEKTPAHYRCGCLQRELNIELCRYRNETEDRPYYKEHKHWEKEIKSYRDKIRRCRHISHESYTEFSNSREMVKLIEGYVGPWKRNFQS